jgi:peroxiredoxin
MGKAARLKRERSRAQTTAPSAVSERTILLASALLALAGALVVGVLLVTRPSHEPPPSAAPSAAESDAPSALVRAADAVGFRPNVEPGTGEVERLPASAAKPPSNPDLLPVGTRAPTFTLKTPTGETVELGDYRGKAVLLEFFATWCPHCAAATPFVRELFATLPPSKYAWLSVNGDGEDAASVYAYHRYFGIDSPALLDPSAQPGTFRRRGAAGPVTTRYRVQAFPTFYVVDAGGRVAWRSDGEQPNALLERELRKAARA